MKNNSKHTFENIFFKDCRYSLYTCIPLLIPLTDAHATLAFVTLKADHENEDEDESERSFRRECEDEVSI
jgi:hypothetical protein